MLSLYISSSSLLLGGLFITWKWQHFFFHSCICYEPSYTDPFKKMCSLLLFYLSKYLENPMAECRTSVCWAFKRLQYFHRLEYLGFLLIFLILANGFGCSVIVKSKLIFKRNLQCSSLCGHAKHYNRQNNLTNLEN